MTSRSITILIGAVLVISLPGCGYNDWHSLFDGQSIEENIHYLGIPDSSVHVPGLPRDSTGQYAHGLGYADPLEVFSVVEIGEEIAIRISGQVIGGLVLADSLENYHLKLKFRWGNKKWDWMEGRPKDGGILYHQGRIRHEFQIHEGDVGSYWARNVLLDIPASYTHDLPESILHAKPYLQPIVNTLHDSMLIFDASAPWHHFNGEGGRKDWQIVIAHPYNENPPGEWNELELICWENHAVHMVNGKVNMVLLNSFYKENERFRPLRSGRLTLQSEGAEIFFKDLKYKNISQAPKILQPYLTN